MNKRLFSYIILALLFLSLIPLFSPSVAAPQTYGNWVIDGDEVYVDDSLVFASATPHTLSGSGDVVFEFKSKVFTGNVDFCWGFNQGVMKPTGIWLWQNYTHSFHTQVFQQDWGSTILYGVTSFADLGIANYDSYVVTLGNKNNTYLYSVNYGTNQTGIYAFTTFSNVGSTYTLSGNYSHWVDILNTPTYFDWIPWDVTYNHIQWNYETMTDWYLTSPQAIVSGTTYKCKVRLEQQQFGLNLASGKYWFAFKPSSETLSQAVSNNHFYCLDPWWNANWSYYKVLNIANKRLGSQMKIVVGNNSGGNVSCGGHIAQGTDFRDIRFVNVANTTEYYHWMENCTVGTQATFWINNSDNASQILMYYGNAVCSASAYLNPHNTFYLYSDVDDVANWVHTTKVDVTASGVYAKVAGVLASLSYYAYLPFDSPIAKYTIQIKSNSDVGASHGGYYEARDGDSSHILSTWGMPNYNSNDITAYYNGGSKKLYDTVTTGTNFINQVYMNETSGKVKYILRDINYTYLDSTGVNSFYNAMTDGMDRILFYSGTAEPGNYDLYIKYIFVTGWFPVTPTWSSFGAEISVGSSNLTATTISNTSIGLSWTNVGTSVLIRNDTTYPPTPFDGTEIYNSTGTTYTDIGLTVSHKYYYRVWLWSAGSWGVTNSSANATTKPNPPYNQAWVQVGSNINVSWLNGTGAKKTVLRMSTTTQPLTPTDGTEIYNGTAHYKVQAVTGIFYITLFSFNTTSGHFSTGVTLSSYFVFVRCYNESSGLLISGYSVFFTNPLGTQTYMHDGCTNPHIINTSVIPQGNDISLMVNATGYYARTYVMDIIITGNYYINAYLVPISATLYYLRVVETIESSYTPYDQAVEDASVIIKRYINATVGYEIISSLYTDANGYVNLQLVPYVHYKVFLNKSGYDDKVSEYTPAPPNEYGQTVEKVFRIVRTTGGFTNITTFDDAYDFYATMYTNNTINIVCQELIAATTNAQIYVYETYNTTITLFNSHSYIGTVLNLSIWEVGINTAREYIIILNVNHSLIGYSIQTLYVLPITVYNQTKINATDIENKIADHFGAWDLGYVKTILLFLPTICLIVLFGAGHQPGLGLFIAGCYLGGILKFIQFDLGTAAQMGMLAGLFIVMGILVIIAKRKGWYD
jgi:hypothetical protein